MAHTHTHTHPTKWQLSVYVTVSRLAEHTVERAGIVSYRPLHPTPRTMPGICWGLSIEMLMGWIGRWKDGWRDEWVGEWMDG